jgi:hypothetical protein
MLFLVMFDVTNSRLWSSGAASWLALVTSLFVVLCCWPCFVSSSLFLPLWLSEVLPSLFVCNCYPLSGIYAQACSRKKNVREPIDRPSVEPCASLEPDDGGPREGVIGWERVECALGVGERAAAGVEDGEHRANVGVPPIVQPALDRAACTWRPS